MKARLKREMTRAFLTEFRSSLSNITLSREDPNEQYDPVTETYSGGTGDITDTFDGLFRLVKEDIEDRENLTEHYSRFTTLQDWATMEPEINDKVIDNTTSEVWRVVHVKEDTTKVFYTMTLKKIGDENA